MKKGALGLPVLDRFDNLKTWKPKRSGISLLVDAAKQMFANEIMKEIRVNLKLARA